MKTTFPFRRIATVLLIATALAAAFGCSSKNPMPPLSHKMVVDPPPGSDMLTANTYAGDAISAMLLQRIGSSSNILAVSMVDMEDMDASSAFGRTAMQQLASRVSQNGFTVIDVRLTNEMRMDLRQGEFMLSRNTAKILSRDHDAHAVLVGVYSRADGKIFVSTRAIRLPDAAVIAAYEYYLPMASDTQYMMSDKTGRDSSDATWRRYVQRGPAFAAASPAPAAYQPAPVAKSTPKAAPQRKTVKRKAVPKKNPCPPCPETKVSMGKAIDPGAAPTPIGAQKK